MKKDTKLLDLYKLSVSKLDGVSADDVNAAVNDTVFKSLFTYDTYVGLHRSISTLNSKLPDDEKITSRFNIKPDGNGDIFRSIIHELKSDDPRGVMLITLMTKLQEEKYKLELYNIAISMLTYSRLLGTFNPTDGEYEKNSSVLNGWLNFVGLHLDLQYLRDVEETYDRDDMVADLFVNHPDVRANSTALALTVFGIYPTTLYMGHFNRSTHMGLVSNMALVNDNLRNRTINISSMLCSTAKKITTVRNRNMFGIAVINQVIDFTGDKMKIAGNGMLSVAYKRCLENIRRVRRKYELYVTSNTSDQTLMRGINNSISVARFYAYKCRQYTQLNPVVVYTVMYGFFERLICDSRLGKNTGERMDNRLLHTLLCRLSENHGITVTESIEETLQYCGAYIGCYFSDMGIEVCDDTAYRLSKYIYSIRTLLDSYDDDMITHVSYKSYLLVLSIVEKICSVNNVSTELTRKVCEYHTYEQLIPGSESLRRGDKSLFSPLENFSWESIQIENTEQIDAVVVLLFDYLFMGSSTGLVDSGLMDLLVLPENTDVLRIATTVATLVHTVDKDADYSKLTVVRRAKFLRGE